MITIDRGQGIELIDESLLDGPHYQTIDNDNELTKVTEYFLDGKSVHRAVHIHLKKGLDFFSTQGRVG